LAGTTLHPGPHGPGSFGSQSRTGSGKSHPIFSKAAQAVQESHRALRPACGRQANASPGSMQIEPGLFVCARDFAATKTRTIRAAISIFLRKTSRRKLLQPLPTIVHPVSSVFSGNANVCGTPDSAQKLK
jgi:hypothetical protein